MHFDNSIKVVENNVMWKFISSMLFVTIGQVNLGSKIMRLLAMILLATPLFCFLLFSERVSVIDQENYLNYFQAAGSGEWKNFFSDVAIGNPMSWLRVFTEEIVWWGWIEFLGFLSPEDAVRFTTVTISGLFFVVALKLQRPILVFWLWIVLPYSFSVVGFYQIRQGFAFAVFVFLGVVFRKYFLGLLIASAIHTTFAVPMFFFAVAKLFARTRLKIISVVLVAIAVPLVLGLFFEQIAGRRGDEYLITEGAASINFVLSMLLMAFLPLVLIVFENLRRQVMSVLPLEYLTTYFAVLIFLFVSFFAFPIGTARVGYFSVIFLIPIFGSINYSILSNRVDGNCFLISSLLITCAFLFYQIFVLIKTGFYFCLDAECL